MSESALAVGSELCVRVTGLVKQYEDLVAVGGIDFEVAKGTCLGILGPNGAGKTTTIEILEGLKQPDAGQVEVLGRTWKADPTGIRERIGVQLQETVLTEKLTVMETVRLFRSFYASGRSIDEVLELVGLNEKRNARVGALSGGQKQRLALGCALVNRPELLFLDEPTTGLDPQARRSVWEVISDLKRTGGTVILTTHYMDEAEQLSDDLIIVDQGKIVTRGTPKEIIA
ncbi:MAG: ABC-2 type transport system ATP-binding protein, partial [Planctomycetota bacterium]